MGSAIALNRAKHIGGLRQNQALYSPEQLQAIIERERARADRNGHVFTLVVFDLDKATSNLPSLQRVVEALVGRVRSIDEVGWLDRRRLAAVLPYTPADGAWKLAADVWHAVAGNDLRQNCEVYTYPAPWLAFDNANGKPLELPAPPFERKSGQSPDDFVLTQHAAEGEAGPVEVQPAREALVDRPGPAEGMALLFARHLPAWKRALDIAGALLALIVLSPILLLITILIKLVSPGPAFFHQIRLGYLGQPFTLWKFRTMKMNANASMHQTYLSNLISVEQPMTKLDWNKDLRIIPFGNVLRLSGLDELPQLFNVLLGDMSLVGPRPCLPYEAGKYLLWQKRRWDAVPGLTGLWQVSGKNRTTFKEMIRFDIAYSRKISLRLDAKIIFKTIPAIIAQISDFLSNQKPGDSKK